MGVQRHAWIRALRAARAVRATRTTQAARARRATLPVVASMLWASTLMAQPATAPPPEIVKAQAALQAGRADSAIAILTDFFARNPTATTGKLLLGNAYRQNNNLPLALATYTSITQPRPQMLQAMFSAAAIHASQQRPDSALRLLRDLKATGAFDVNMARTATAFRSLQRDPRFAAVMFQKSDFVQPFVEPVRVLREFVGEHAGDQFSWIARNIGDVNGDRVNDFVTSAPSFGTTGAGGGRGKVYVYSGRTGELIWSQIGEPGEGLGTGLEGAGDVDRDGVGDVVAGAPGGNRAVVYSGRDGRILHTLLGDSTGGGFGTSAAGAGDQNADGIADVIVGAPGFPVANQPVGRAYIFSGRDGARLFTLTGENAGDAFGSIVAGDKHGKGTPLLVGAPNGGAERKGQVVVFDGVTRSKKFTIDADSTGNQLGAMFTSLVGDVNGDHIADVYAADFSDAARGPATGRVYVHSGADGKRLFQLSGANAGDGFGIGSADIGDVNKDGFDDLLVGAWQYAGAAQSGGRVYLYSGKDGTVLRTITGKIAGETLGFDATGIGDVNRDGVIDLLVTSSWSNVNGFRSGRMFIISGK